MYFILGEETFLHLLGATVHAVCKQIIISPCLTTNNKINYLQSVIHLPTLISMNHKLHNSSGHVIIIWVLLSK